jgi:hypothetical protein
MFRSGFARVASGLLLGIAVAGCGSSADASENVAKACTAFQEADEQTIETVGPYLETMVTESAAAAKADSQYQAFADAAVLLSTLVTSEPEDSTGAIEDDFEALVEALEAVESTCSSG